MFFHIPTEGLANAIQSIINLWRGTERSSPASLYSKPVAARRNRIWRRVYAAVVTLLFLLMMAGVVWLVVIAFTIEPPTPEQILQRREPMPRRAASSWAPQPADASRGSNAAPVQP